MEFKIISQPDKDVLQQIANIHYDSLNRLSFLTILGEKFLYHLYKIILENKIGFFAIAVAKNEVLGFTFLGLDKSKLMPAVLKSPFPLIFSSIESVLKRPQLLVKIVKTFKYFGGEPSVEANVKAEFLATAIKEENRSRGIGTQLLEVFEKEYFVRGVKEYKFAVAQENVDSVNFFKNRGFKVIEEFDFSGTIWYIYIKKIIITNDNLG